MRPGGRFITLEGGDGSGKSTQARRLADRLRAAGRTVVSTREPGGSPLAERIRETILAERPVAPEAEALLFAAARADHIAVTIQPALAAGAFVVCDRFFDSTAVYQGVLAGIDRQLIACLRTHTVGDCVPDLTLVLDIDVAAARLRAQARGALSRFDAADTTSREIVRQGFLEIAAREPNRCAVIDASQDADAVAVAIWAEVSRRLGLGDT
ncbi:MAG: dTMP kinase [Hyphomicrobiaceae bacterium]|nr:dTMP kinase [Hyphomicrobiaceae bacterium]